MGAADVVPGVSGGTIALIVGIYETLIDQVRAGAKALGMLVRGDLRGFWKQVRALDVTFLLPLAIGILLAVGGLASVLETQLEENPEEMKMLRDAISNILLDGADKEQKEDDLRQLAEAFENILDNCDAEGVGIEGNENE